MTCTRCAADKPRSDFSTHRSGRPQTWCKPCVNEYSRERYASRPEVQVAVKARARVWAKQNPDKRAAQARAMRARWKSERPESIALLRRNWEIRKKYGLTPDDYDALLASQGGVCAICRGAPAKRPFAVDHCHRTGRVRGLLCNRCNVAIGNFRDDAEIIQRALDYLQFRSGRVGTKNREGIGRRSALNRGGVGNLKSNSEFRP